LTDQEIAEAFELVETDVHGMSDEINVLKGVMLAVVVMQVLNVILHIWGRRANANAE
jgi:hypothetical protein